MWFFVVNKVEKQDLKMKNPQKPFLHSILNLFFILIALGESKTYCNGSSLRPFLEFPRCDNEAD